VRHFYKSVSLFRHFIFEVLSMYQTGSISIFYFLFSSRALSHKRLFVSLCFLCLRHEWALPTPTKGLRALWNPRQAEPAPAVFRRPILSVIALLLIPTVSCRAMCLRNSSTPKGGGRRWLRGHPAGGCGHRPPCFIARSLIRLKCPSDHLHQSHRHPHSPRITAHKALSCSIRHCM